MGNGEEGEDLACGTVVLEEMVSEEEGMGLFGSLDGGALNLQPICGKMSDRFLRGRNHNAIWCRFYSRDRVLSYDMDGLRREREVQIK